MESVSAIRRHGFLEALGGTGHSVLPSLDLMEIRRGRTLAHSDSGTSFSHCLPTLVQQPACTSLGECLVATLLNPAEQFTTFHATREDDYEQRGR